MSGFYDLKNRINSTKNTGQVTKALQIVAASKQKKTQDNLKNSRHIRNGLKETIAKIRKDLAKSVTQKDLPDFFIENKESKKVLIVNIMSQKGLCGGLNSKLFYRVINLKKDLEKEGKEIDFISVNRVSQKYLRSFNENVIAFFGEIKESPELDDVMPLIQLIKESHKKYNKIYIAYSNFIKTGIYEPKIEQLLPVEIQKEESESRQLQSLYLIEPNPMTVLDKVANFYIELEVYEAILSNIASENTARMISMKKATDNIKTLVDSLALKLNKERQAKITQQVAEISANL